MSTGTIYKTSEFIAIKVIPLAQSGAIIKSDQQFQYKKNAGLGAARQNKYCGVVRNFLATVLKNNIQQYKYTNVFCI